MTQLATYTPRFGLPRQSSAIAVTTAAIMFCVSYWTVAQLQWPSAASALRAIALPSFEGLAPGVDVTFLLAHSLWSFWGLEPTSAVLGASLSAMPFLFALVLRTTPDGRSPLAVALWVTGNPATWVLMLSGLGWVALGFFGLWRLLTDLPDRPPHQGMPLAGIGIGGAILCIPDYTSFALPLAGMLWLVAPRHMLGRHMRVFYLLSFTPMLMIWASYAYAEWLYGGGTGLSAAWDGRLATGMTALQRYAAVGLVLAPLVLGAGPRSQLMRYAVAASLGFAAVTGASIGLVLTGAMLAQSAIAARFEAPPVVPFIALLSAFAMVLGVEVFTVSGG